ncbi:MAG: hypothetical protein NTZ55_02520 [Candidatus Roizmanbacteria bacterium]|nr:hypothetical protein [Candidatus Roizmanbacteria bacterium]
MIHLEGKRFEPVADLVGRVETDLPRTTLPILLKDGSILSQITPALIVPNLERNMLDDHGLNMVYLDPQNIVGTVDLNKISGLDVVMEHDQFYVETTYFGLKDNTMESIKRRLRIKGIKFGVQENHAKAGEMEDFYIVADDMQYVGQAGKNPERNFPFWRLGIYGPPENMREIFQPSRSTK